MSTATVWLSSVGGIISEMAHSYESSTCNRITSDISVNHHPELFVMVWEHSVIGSLILHLFRFYSWWRETWSGKREINRSTSLFKLRRLFYSSKGSRLISFQYVPLRHHLGENATYAYLFPPFLLFSFALHFSFDKWKAE